MSWLDALLGGIKNVFIGGVQVPAPQGAPLNFATGATGTFNPVTGAVDVTVTATAVASQSSASVANGANHNVATSGSQTLRLTGPTGAFSIGGLNAGGVPAAGTTVFVVNTTTQTMAILNEDAASSAANRITTQTGSTVYLPTNREGSAAFIYDGTTGRWVLQNIGTTQPIWRNILDFGGVGDNSTNNDTAIAAALASIPATGGTLYFPAGIYQFHTPISITAITNLTLKGDGCRYMQDFDNPPTQLLYTSAGSGDGGIVITGNFARDFRCEDIDVSYNNSGFTGSLVFVNLSPGAVFHHSTLGGNGAGSGYLSSAASVVKVVGCENVKFNECLLQQAQRSLWLPNTGALSTGTTVRDCQLGNVTRAWVEVESGSAIGIILEDTLFDATSIANSTYGLLISTNGFKIKGNRFAGGNSLKTPTNSCANLSGSGEFSNNTLLTSNPGIILNVGGVYYLEGNYGQGSPPLTILGGMVSGSGNFWTGNTQVQMTGAPNITFANSGHTITRNTGSFLTDGFLTGQSVTVSGSASNNGVIGNLTNVSTLVLTFGSGLVNEGPVGGVTITAFAVTNYAPTVYVNTGNAACSLDFGPDTHSALAGGIFTGSSIDVVPGGGSTSTGGVVKYNPQFDQSTLGPIVASGADSQVCFRNYKFQSWTQGNCPVDGALGAYGNMGIFTLPSHTMDRNGVGLRWRAWGRTPNTTDVASIKAAFGSTKMIELLNFVTTTQPSGGTLGWEIHGELFRAGSSSQSCISTGTINNTFINPLYVSGSEDLSADITFTIQGGGATSVTDVILDGFDVEIIQ